MNRTADIDSPNAAWVVSVHDADGPRRERIVGALRMGGLTTQTSIATASMACIALDACAEGEAEAAISAAVARGARVLAYSQGSDAWRIGRRCHVVLLGAALLLDSAAPRFLQEMAAAARSWLREADASRRDAQACARRMAAQGLVGTSAALRTTFGLVERVARLPDLPVLLHGETGSGKELLARAIHRLDTRRSAAPFVAVNCAAISPALAEAELFGHQRGAYTGAHRDKRGLVRAADGGTLFLDEVGELADELQAKLLRTLQERRVLPVGAEREEAVDVRIVAATHRDLAARVREGRFREDLYFRLAVLPIEVPPLRARREDIGPLVDHFLSVRTRRATSAFREALAQCELPGNVRELENLVQQALVAAGEHEVLDLPHLPGAVLRGLDCSSGVPAPESPSAAGAPSMSEPASRDAALTQLFAAEDWKLARCADACERRLLQAALERSRGNQTAAARLLGVTPRCVYTKLRKHLLA